MLVVLKTLLFMLALQAVAIGTFRWSLKPSFRQMVGTTEVGLLLLIPVIGLFGQNGYALYALLVVAALTAFGSAEKLVRRFMLLLVCFPAIPTTIMIGGAYICEADAVGFFALGGLIALIGLGRTRDAVAPALHLAAWTIFLACLLLTVRGVPLNGVLREIPALFLAIMVPFYIAATGIRTNAMATSAALAIVWGGMCNSVVAIFESVRHWLLYQSFYAQLHATQPLGVSATLSVRAGMLRAHGIVFDYESLGFLTAIAMITATAFRSRFRPVGFGVIALTLTGGCLASQARGGWIAAAVGLMALAIYEHRWRMLAAIAGAAAPLVLVIGAISSNHERFAQFIGSSGHGQQTLDYRSALFSRGLNEVLGHPWTGQTRDQLEASMNDMRQSQHIIDFVNVHLNVALIGGFPLLAMWLLAFLAPIYLSWRARPRTPLPGSSPPLGLPLALVLASAVFIAGTSLTDRIISIIMIGIGLTASFLRLNAAPAGDGVRETRRLPPRKPLVQPLPV